VKTLWRARTSRGFETIEKFDDRFYLIGPESGEPGTSYGGHEGTLDKLDAALNAYNVREQPTCPSPFHSGEFNPRIWRGRESPSPQDVGLVSEWTYSVRASRAHAARLRDILRHIDADPAHDNVYSHELRDLLILAATDVESAWKSILRANGVSPARGTNRWTTEDYCKLIVPLRLREWEVCLSAHPGYPSLRPFAAWDSSLSTTSLDWYSAYNAVKHDREREFSQAKFGHVVAAAAAVFVLTVAQFGPSHLDLGATFHPDEFRLVTEPDWTANETYIRPLKTGRSVPLTWLGHPTWTAVHCQF
jgi:hypothetical protein